MCVAYGIYECVMWERAVRFISVTRILFLEMPLLITEVFMLQSQSIVDWRNQNPFLATHCMFIVSLSISTCLDSVMKFRINNCKICSILTTLVIGYILACMAYAPVSIAMFGFTTEKVALVDFNDIIGGELHKNVLFILMRLGQTGQLFWIACTPALAIYFFVIQIYSKKISRSNHFEEDEGGIH